MIKNKVFFQKIASLPLVWKILIILVLFSFFLYLINLYLIKQNTQYFPWNNIQPNTTTLDEVKNKLGDPISTKTNGSQVEYGYKSSYPSFPNQVVGESNKVKFVREWVPIDPPKLITEYTQTLGEPEYTTNAIDEGFIMYAYPSKGVAIDFHNTTKEVFHILHFQRMSTQQFIQEYQQFLSSENSQGAF